MRRLPLGIIQQQTLGGGANSTLLTGLVSWWNFEETSGTRYDSHDGNDLVEDLPVGYGTGKIDNAIFINNTNSVRINGTTGTMDLRGGDRDFSIACWAKADALGGLKGLCNMSYNNSGVQSATDYILVVDGTTPKFYIATGNAWQIAISSATLTTGTWYLICATHKASTKTMTISVNGGARNSTVYAGTANNVSNMFRLARYHTGGYFWWGHMDSFGFWEKALTTAEEIELYNSNAGLAYSDLFGVGLPIPESGLISMLDGSVSTSFWSDNGKTTNSTEGGAVAVWEDQSGNGNDWVQTNASYRPLAHLSAGRLYNNGTSGSYTDKHLVGPNLSAETEFSFFARVQNVSSPQGGIWGATTWASSQSAGHWSYSINNGTRYICLASTTRPSAWFWTSLPESSLDLMTYEENINSAAVTTAYVNGVQRYSGDLGTLGIRPSSYLGCTVYNNIPSYSGGFYFYKFCAYNRIVSAAERITINAWLES